MAHQIRLTLDDKTAAQLAALAERAQAQPDELAVALLSDALVEFEHRPADTTEVLDRIPGAWDRFQLGREQAGRDEIIGLDEL